MPSVAYGATSLKIEKLGRDLERAGCGSVVRVRVRRPLSEAPRLFGVSPAVARVLPAAARVALPTFGALTLLVLSSSARAAEASSGAAKVGEAEEHEKLFLIRPFIALDQLSLDLTRGDETLTFLPNTKLAVGLRLGYAGFSISASVDVQASEESSEYGKTEYLALQLGRGFRVARRELFISAFLQYHEGLYLESSSDAAPGPIVFPELTVLSLGVTATYYLNPEFSYDDTFVEFRPREDSVGSWTLRLSSGLMGFDNVGLPVIPEPYRAAFGAEGTLAESSALYVGAMGGYSVDFRFWGGWCVASSLLIGLTVAREAHTVEPGTRRDTTVAPSAMFALALGYSGETLHAGIYTFADIESYKTGPVQQDITRTAVALFVGVRF